MKNTLLTVATALALLGCVSVAANPDLSPDERCEELWASVSSFNQTISNQMSWRFGFVLQSAAVPQGSIDALFELTNSTPVKMAAGKAFGADIIEIRTKIFELAACPVPEIEYGVPSEPEAKRQRA